MAALALAKAASTFLTQDTVAAVACRYPPEEAIRLAESLSLDSGMSDTDLRLAQSRCVDDVFQDKDVVDPGRLVKRIGAMRLRRFNAANARYAKISADTEESARRKAEAASI